MRRAGPHENDPRRSAPRQQTRTRQADQANFGFESSSNDPSGERETSETAKTSQRAASDVDQGFASVVNAFARYRDVTRGGKGFGSTGLKVNGKLFALMSSQGKFVAKLPRRRVDAL